MTRTAAAALLACLLCAWQAAAEDATTTPPPALALYRVETYGTIMPDGSLLPRPIAPFTLTIQRDDDWILVRFRNPRRGEDASLRLPILEETPTSISASSRRGDSLLFIQFDQNHLTFHRLHTSDGTSSRLHARRITP